MQHRYQFTGDAFPDYTKYVSSSSYTFLWSSLVAQMVKNVPTKWETWVRSLGQKDPLEKEMATPSSILAWGNPTDRGAWRATVHGVTEESDMT